MSTLPFLAIDCNIVETPAVAFFDTAVAGKHCRQILLNLFLSVVVYFEDNKDLDGRDFITWLKEREKKKKPSHGSI